MCVSMFPSLPPSPRPPVPHSVSPLAIRAGDLCAEAGWLAARLMLAFMRMPRAFGRRMGGLKFVPERADTPLGGAPDVSALHQLLAVVKTISLGFFFVVLSHPALPAPGVLLSQPHNLSF